MRKIRWTNTVNMLLQITPWWINIKCPMPRDKWPRRIERRWSGVKLVDNIWTILSSYKGFKRRQLRYTSQWCQVKVHQHWLNWNHKSRSKRAWCQWWRITQESVTTIEIMQRQRRCTRHHQEPGSTKSRLHKQTSAINLPKITTTKFPISHATWLAMW